MVANIEFALNRYNQKGIQVDRKIIQSIIWAFVMVMYFGVYVAAQTNKTMYLASDSISGLPTVTANDNRSPAGIYINGILEIDLELVLSDFRPETPDRPGIKVWALAEKGKAPEIPSPLIRVKKGTQIKATITNTRTDSTLYVLGFKTRPIIDSEPIAIHPGETKTFNFDAGEQGTYLYNMNMGISSRRFGPENEHLSGAFVVDPEVGAPDDRILVMNIVSQNYDSTYEYGFLEALTINGKSWPFTEKFTPSVGDTLDWKIINGSRRSHPMHLHGFFYEVLSIGSVESDDIYTKENQRLVVTEFMRGLTTMEMRWTPTRSGNWLFHCHLSFHVSPELRLPLAEEHDQKHNHMAGLVMGIEVEPGETDLISKGEVKKLDLYVNEYSDDPNSIFGFSLDSEFKPDSIHLSDPGPLLLLEQYHTTEVTVINRMSQPTGIHWHGLEIDSWSDGVPDYSASDGKVSPTINPGESFTYKLSQMRPGTFIYHSHLNDVEQLIGGLYGPLIVIPEGESYDEETNHIYSFQWGKMDINSLADFSINGIPFTVSQPVVEVKVGESHRLRLINIAPASDIRLEMTKDSLSYPLQVWAKDGADLPENQQINIDIGYRIGVGETIDYLFTPTKPDIYELNVGFQREFSAKQKWIVTE